ncbi:MAG: hypothetical protein P8N02_10165 [Actinomycetota bacterium]|jgi:hypothetical protein|nr:hypothetical protein [Actinomycetota bacterium]
MNDYLEPFAARGMAPTAPIEATWDISAGAGDVWAAISESSNLTNVHPFCATNEVERWPGLGSRDHVHYYGGIHYQRDVLDWRDGVGYDLAVGPPSGKIALARWWIDSTGPDRCRFGIEVTSFVRTDVSASARAQYEDTVIKGAIPPYLAAVVRGVGHYSETGTPVARNQFGAHDIYSPAVS